jgi:hypothetical protein
VLDAAAVRQLFAETAARLRRDRQVAGIPAVGVILPPPRPDVDERAKHTLGRRGHLHRGLHGETARRPIDHVGGGIRRRQAGGGQSEGGEARR